MDLEKLPAVTNANTCSKPEDDDGFVDLVVGGYPYTVKRTLLLRSVLHSDNDEDEVGDNFFVSLLSGRWKRDKRTEPIQIPEMDGRLFFYVLYFLQVGDLPRSANKSAFHSFLYQEDIMELQSQADFFGLTRLVDLCEETNGVLKGDLNLSHLSDFTIEVEDDELGSQFFEMSYWYKKKKRALAELGYSEPCGKYLQVRSDGKNIADTDSFESTFDSIKNVIKEMYKRKEMSVTRALDQVPDIPPKARLWYACCYFKSKKGYHVEFLGYYPSCFTMMNSVY